MAIISLTKNTTIDEPFRLKSGDVFSSNGYWVEPAKGYDGAAIDIADSPDKPSDSVNDCIVFNSRFQKFHRAINLAGKVNYTTIQNVRIVDCLTGIVSASAWDSTFINVSILRCVHGVMLSGSKQRPSNPHTFFNLQVESFTQSAVVLSDTYNIEFHGGKFHGKIDVPPDNHTFVCLTKNWPPMVFHGGKFFFNPMGHFDKSDKPKVKLIAPMLDNFAIGNVSVTEPIFNERGK